MKICFIVGAFPPMKCGIGDYTYNLFNKLIEKDIEVEVITSHKGICNNANEIRVHECVEKWTFDNKEVILNKLKEIKPDIVHIQYPSNEYGSSFFINILPNIIKKKLGIKVVETVHEYLTYTYKGKIRNLINYKSADSIVVVEKQYIEKIKSFIPYVSKGLNIEYIPISSNIPKSNISLDEIDSLKKELGLAHEKVISYFGFVNELKGMETLIKALKELLDNNVEVKLLLLSELNSKNEYQKNILEKIKKYNLEKDIIITGFVDSAFEVANYLKASDIAILPFRDGVSERNGSFLAAYNQGIPIITTSLNRKDSEEGVFYVPPSDAKSIVKCAEEILKSEKKYSRRIISWEEIAEQYIDVYERLTKRH